MKLNVSIRHRAAVSPAEHEPAYLLARSNERPHDVFRRSPPCGDGTLFFVNLTVRRAAVHEVFMLGGLSSFLVLLFSFAVVVIVLADDAVVSTLPSSSGLMVAAHNHVYDA